MKKLLSMFLVFIMAILSSCINKETTDGTKPETTGPIEYGSIQADWDVYKNANDITEFANTVYIGKVNGISFRIEDPRTGQPPAKDAKEKYKIEFNEDLEPWMLYCLTTLYNVEVISTLKGENIASVQIRVAGGLEGYREEEQITASREYGINTLYFSRNATEIKIGETYLFVLYKFDNCAPTPVNINQSIYNIQDPLIKHTLYNHDDETKYYSGNMDKYGNPLISAKDVISAFGEDKWDAFWTDWQKTNPGWESRFDMAEVEKALAKE